MGKRFSLAAGRMITIGVVLTVLFWAGQGLTQAQFAIDHFKCYDVRGSIDRPVVSLRDQFEEQAGVRVKRPLALCNPVEKTVEGEFTPITDEAAHLTCYQTKDPRGEEQFAGRNVLVSNQFGDNQTLEVKERANRLCVPSEKDGEPPALILDHFKCYTARDGGVSQDVTLEDQFEVYETKVLRPVFLCNPVDKNGEGIIDPITT